MLQGLQPSAAQRPGTRVAERAGRKAGQHNAARLRGKHDCLPIAAGGVELHLVAIGIVYGRERQRQLCADTASMFGMTEAASGDCARLLLAAWKPEKRRSSRTTHD